MCDSETVWFQPWALGYGLGTFFGPLLLLGAFDSLVFSSIPLILVDYLICTV